LDDDEEDNIALAQKMTPATTQVSAEDCNILFDASDDEDD